MSVAKLPGHLYLPKSMRFSGLYAISSYSEFFVNGQLIPDRPGFYYTPGKTAYYLGPDRKMFKCISHSAPSVASARLNELGELMCGHGEVILFQHIHDYEWIWTGFLPENFGTPT